MTELYAHKGDRVTCERGHLIGTFTRDFPRHSDAIMPDDLEMGPGVPKMKLGEEAGNCPICGAPWNMAFENISVAYLHFEKEGWRR